MPEGFGACSQFTGRVNRDPSIRPDRDSGRKESLAFEPSVFKAEAVRFRYEGRDGSKRIVDERPIQSGQRWVISSVGPGEKAIQEGGFNESKAIDECVELGGKAPVEIGIVLFSW
jgi:hypothetical protein